MTKEKLNTMIVMIAKLDNEAQNAFYKTMLEQNVMTKENIETLQKMVCFYKMQNNKEFYNAIQEKVAIGFLSQVNNK